MWRTELCGIFVAINFMYHFTPLHSTSHTVRPRNVTKDYGILPPSPLILKESVTGFGSKGKEESIYSTKYPATSTCPCMHTDGLLDEQLLLEIKAGLKYALQTENKVTFCIHGTGSTALEAVLDNVIETGDRVLVPSYGDWAEHAAEAATRFGAEPIVVWKERGTTFSPEEVILLIETHKPDVVVLVIGDSTGQTMRVDGIGDACKLHGCLLVADISRVLGDEPFLMDAWGIDCVYAGVEKGLGAPGGLGIVSFSGRAMKKVLTRNGRTKNWLFDMRNWLNENYWHIRDENEEAGSTHSLSTPLLCSLRDNLYRIAISGLATKWELELFQHSELRRRLKEEIPTLEFFGDPDNWLVAYILFYPPKGRSNKEVSHYAKKKHGVFVSSRYEGMCGVNMAGRDLDSDLVEKIVAAVKDAWKHLEIS